MNTVHKALLIIAIVLLGQSVGAEDIDDSTKLWNRLDPLTERCRLTTDSVQIEKMAIELLALSDMP